MREAPVSDLSMEFLWRDIMMKNKKTLRWLTTLVLSLLTHQAIGSGQYYGEKMSNSESIRISELTSNPEQYVDQRVKIEGLVDDVCPMKGCWVDILDTQSRDILRFKVQDDVIVFPVEARGSQIVAEGILRRHDLTREQAEKHLRHLAREKGEPFDETSVKGAMVFYQIEGIGAVMP
jgi:hypothetical protein